MSSGAHRRTSRSALVLLQLLVFVTYIFGPTAAFAEEPTPEPTPTESVAPEPSAEPTAEPTAVPTAEPTAAPVATPAPAEPTAAPTASPEPQAAPTIASEKDDYPPGGYVILTGENWQPGETVTIRTNDDQGESWRRDVTVTADPEGRIRDEFNLPDWFVATYIVTASGPLSGIARTMFTDGNVKVEVAPAGVTAVVTGTLYSQAGCTGLATAKSVPGTVGVGSAESLRLNAPATGSASTAPTTRYFVNWTVEAGAAFTVIPGTNNRSICVSGNFNGSRDAVANYGTTAPTVATSTAVTSGTNPSTYGGSVTFTATVTGSPVNPSSVGTVAFKDNGTTLCFAVALSGNQAICTTSSLSAGTHPITADYSGAAGFNASTGSMTQTVTAKMVTVTPDAGQGKTFGDADPALTYTLSEAVTVSGALARAGGEDVGSYAINLGTLTATSSNYSLALSSPTVNFTIGAKTVVITPESGQSKVYGTPDPSAFDFSNDAGLSAEDFTGWLVRESGEDVGAYAIGLGTLSAGSNYSLSLASVVVSFEITQRAIEVTARPGQSKVYGDLDPTLTFDITSGALVNTDTFSGALDRATGENVGLYAIGQGDLTAGDNYALTFVGDDFAITQRPITVTAVTDSKTYDGTTSSDETPVISDGELAFEDEANFSQSFDTKDVGTDKTLTPAGSVEDGNDGANYLVTFVNDETGEITQRAITVTADAGQTKVYGNDDPASFTYEITSGSLAADDDFSGALDRATGENVASTPSARET